VPNIEADYWFRAKRYGWGWGLPLRWQGWIALLAYALALGAAPALFELPSHALYAALYVVALSAVLLAVCWWKGEPPRWRWGD